MKTRKSGLTKIKLARATTVVLTIILVLSGAIGEFRYGGITSLGFKDFWLTCPLGYLTRSLAARELLPQWVSVGVVVLSILVLGRIYCAWICPTVLLRRIFTGKKMVRSKLNDQPEGINWSAYSSYAVLTGVLVASFVFRFPVFCLVCPVGLFFGFAYAVIRVFTPETAGLELMLFPLMLGLELWGLKSWCRSICPLGALMSIFGSFNRFLQPVVKKEKCLTSRGANCGVCSQVCPEGIDLNKPSPGLSPNSCTKCLECYAKCPAKSIKIAIFR